MMIMVTLLLLLLLLWNLKIHHSYAAEGSVDRSIWSQRPTGLNSTQLSELSPIGCCDHNPRLISTQLIQLSQVLWFWTFGCVSSWVESSRSNNHSARSNSTQLNQVTIQSRPSFLFHRVGKVNKCSIGDDTKAAARQSLNWIKNKK